MSNPWEGFCEWVRSQGGNLGNILDSLSTYIQPNLYSKSLVDHQSTYSDIGPTSNDAFSQHAAGNAASFFLSAWQVMVVLLLLAWGALYVSGRRYNGTDRKPARLPDDRPDEGGVGGLD
jgi:hypothetical protein